MRLEHFPILACLLVLPFLAGYAFGIKSGWSDACYSACYPAAVKSVEAGECVCARP